MKPSQRITEAINEQHHLHNELRAAFDTIKEILDELDARIEKFEKPRHGEVYD